MVMSTKLHLPVLIVYYQKYSQWFQCQLNWIQSRAHNTVGFEVTYLDDFLQLLKDEIQHVTPHDWLLYVKPLMIITTGKSSNTIMASII
jgi:hypothetical protein